MSGWFEIMLDGLLALLLIGAIVACWIVSRRLSIIREGQQELRQLVDDLNAAMVEARGGVTVMKNAAREAAEGLDVHLKRARALSDELALMTASANNLADRLEAGVAGKGQALKPPSVEEVKEQQEILDALKEAR